MSNNYIVSSLFENWDNGHNMVMINKVSDGSQVSAYVGSIKAGTTETALNFATAQMKSDDQTLLIALNQNLCSYVQVFSYNITSGVINGQYQYNASSGGVASMTWISLNRGIENCFYTAGFIDINPSIWRMSLNGSKVYDFSIYHPKANNWGQ